MDFHALTDRAWCRPRGLLERRLWDRIQDVALSLYERGAKVAASAGLILADTKYEFGLSRDGDLLLIDEAHTPDSSRYWVAASYDERLAAEQEPESLDKEIVRRAYADAPEDMLMAFFDRPGLAVEFEVREIYLQTPGPGAGTQLVPSLEQS